MPFESRVFQLAKDTEHPEEYQDAYRLDAARGIAAVADGVTTSIFARRWATILTEAAAADLPDPNHKEGFARWLQQRRRAWSEGIDTDRLAWFQRAKLPLGAFSTLLWVHVSRLEEDRLGAFGAYRLRGFAIGDSCLFHVRHGEVLRAFPVQQAAELQRDPLVLGSVDLKRDERLQFARLDAFCYEDDLLVLCTDAIAAWALRLGESGNPPAWEGYWNFNRQRWEDEILRLRNQGLMPYDDATLVLLRVVGKAAEVRRPAGAPVAAEAVRSGSQTVPPDQQPVGPEGARTQTSQSPGKRVGQGGKQLGEGIAPASGRAARGWKKWKQRAVAKYHQAFGRRNK